MLLKLREFKVSRKDLITIYILYIRGILEQSSVVWSSSLTQEEKMSFERVQKSAIRIILQENYQNYQNALKVVNLPTISERHEELLYMFAQKCCQNPKTSYMLPEATPKIWARNCEQYHIPMARKERFLWSAIPQMARALNIKNGK